jgi:hypothetical protein
MNRSCFGRVDGIIGAYKEISVYIWHANGPSHLSMVRVSSVYL